MDLELILLQLLLLCIQKLKQKTFISNPTGRFWTKPEEWIRESYPDFVFSLLQLQEQLLCVESSSLQLLLEQTAPPAPLLSQLRVILHLQALQLLTHAAVLLSELLQERKKTALKGTSV